MSLYRSDIARLAQTRHRTADHDRVRTQHFRDRLRGRWPIVLRHVQQHMKHAGKSAVLSHGDRVARLSETDNASSLATSNLTYTCLLRMIGNRACRERVG